MAGSEVRELLLKLLLDDIAVDILEHILKILIVREVDAVLLQKQRQQIDDFRDLILRVGIYIELDFLSKLRDACLPILGDEYDDREEYRFERDDHGQETERERIDSAEARNHVGVPGDPEYEEETVEEEEGDRTERGGHPVGYLVRQGTLRVRFGLEATDDAPPLFRVREERRVFVIHKCKSRQEIY